MSITDASNESAVINAPGYFVTLDANGEQTPLQTYGKNICQKKYGIFKLSIVISVIHLLLFLYDSAVTLVFISNTNMNV